MNSAQAARQLVDSLRPFDNIEGVQVLTNEHRTNQQKAFRFFMDTIREWAAQDSYDLRNEATITLSKRIIEAVGDEAIPYV